ncbi:MAG TPA: hypothetical protein VF559_07435 [Caulobacteraceae bacterium]|jgi:hypothetical protein
MTDDDATGKAPKDRSPSFPFIPLQTAVERLVAFEQTFGRHDTPANKVGRAWNMKDGSSQAFQTVAALKAFGFLDYRGSGPARATFITDEGRKYLRAQQEEIKREVVRRAALKPKALEKFWELWGPDRPIDDMCLDDLHFKHGFTLSAAETFLRVYDATISYAGLTEPDKGGEGENDLDLGLSPPADVGVGDLVQVEITGALVLPKAARVRAVQPYEGKLWVYVDGSEAAIPMEQVRLEQKGGAAGAAPPPLPLPPEAPVERSTKLGWKEERLIDDSGDETFLSYKGEPSVERYEFIRDYLEFRIQRLKKA